MSEKLLTVSVAVYNVEGYITQLLDSVVSAKNKNEIEVLVIDDGGTDNTLNVALKYQEQYPSVIHAIHKENGGWGSTVNYGIAMLAESILSYWAGMSILI